MIQLPPAIIAVFAPFAIIFSKKKTFAKAALLLVGALLCRGGRTVCATLRILGMKGEARFDTYHRVLNRAQWSPLKGGRILLEQILEKFSPEEPIVIAVDEHIERRSGRKIKAKGCYRDAVRSSKNFLVRCFGLKWITVMLIKNVPWTKRLLALPFLTILAPSEEANKKKNKKHKTTIDWTKQLIKLLHRWLPKARVILSTDGGFATIDLAWTCIKHGIGLVTRLRSDACLYEFPGEYLGRGRRPKKGSRLLPPKDMLKQPDLPWIETEVKWYGGDVRRVAYVTTTCLWGTQGYDPVPIRLILLKDLAGEYEPIVLMGIDAIFKLTPTEIIEWFVGRWSQEVTHREAREHLGIETQRQWSDKAIARTTPALFALYSMIILIGYEINQKSPLKPEKTAWYEKETVTFSDLLGEVRRQLWSFRFFKRSHRKDDPEEIILSEEALSLIDQLSEVA